MLLRPSDALLHEVPLPVHCLVVDDRDPVVIGVPPFVDDEATQVIGIVLPVRQHMPEAELHHQRLDL